MVVARRLLLIVGLLAVAVGAFGLVMPIRAEPLAVLPAGITQHLPSTLREQTVGCGSVVDPWSVEGGGGLIDVVVEGVDAALHAACPAAIERRATHSVLLFVAGLTFVSAHWLIHRGER